MSGIKERTMIIGKVKLSGKRERFVAFPWDLVGSGPASGWEPAEMQSMGRVNHINRLNRQALPNVLASHIEIRDYLSPFFYDEECSEKTLLHGGFVQIV
jgi:hypothetical protein